MEVEIREAFDLVLWGASAQHQAGHAYGDEIRAALDPVWAEIRTRKFGHDGINIVIYDAQGDLFAGVRLDAEPQHTTLQRQHLALPRYAYAKHVGSYAGIPAAYQELDSALKKMGYVRCAPVVEIYGHWTDDESRLETEILCAIKALDQQ